jgi:F-type H+-transporting ATPase subunit epsilon
MGRISVSILTPEKVIFEGSADEIYMHLHDGERGFLPGHAPIMGTLGIGLMRLREAGKVSAFEIEGGFLEMSGNRMIVLAEEAMKKEELSEKSIQSEIRRLEGLLEGASAKEAAGIRTELKKMRSRLATVLLEI